MSERRAMHFSGRVQGVGFRYTAERLAKATGLTGYVRNLADGRVRLIAEGSTAALDSFTKALQSELTSHIEKHDVVSESATGEFDDFTIRY